jgi:hypothetical protein
VICGLDTFQGIGVTTSALASVLKELMTMVRKMEEAEKLIFSERIPLPPLMTIFLIDNSSSQKTKVGLL